MPIVDVQGNQGLVDPATSAQLVKVVSGGSPPDTAATSTLSATGSVTQAVGSQATSEFQIVPTAFVGTLVFEASYDSAATWNPLNVWPQGSVPEGNTVTSVTNPAAEATYVGSIVAATNVRVRCSAYTSGSVAVTVRSSAVPSVVVGAAQVNQGSAGSSPWPVTAAATVGAYTDHSGTITVGGTAQQAVGANANRKKLLIQNPTNAVGTLWFNFTTTAVASQPSLSLQPGGSFESSGDFVSTEAISVIASDTGHPFVVKDA